MDIAAWLSCIVVVAIVEEWTKASSVRLAAYHSKQLPDGSVRRLTVSKYKDLRKSDEGKKSQESNIGDSDNTRDDGKTAGKAIITWGGGITSYACMFFIYRSSCKDEKTSMSKRYLVKSSEDSGETFLGKITVVILVWDRCPREKGKITVVILVRDRCPRGKGNLPKVDFNLEAKCTLPTEGMRSIISTVSISLEGFLPSILLLVMIIVAVVIVAVILVVVVVAVIVVMISGVFIIVTIIRVVVFVVVGVSFILKLSFMIISFLHRIAL
ncbi:hypothetical protein Tco_0561997 [Tanacetum coccineum]